METLTTLNEHKIFTGTNARGDWSKTVFFASDGREYGTFKADVASKGINLIGQPVKVEYSENKRGDFTNYVLENVTTQNGAAEPAAAQEPAPATTHVHVLPDHGSKDWQIARAVGLKEARETFQGNEIDPLQSLSELYELAAQHARFLVTGEHKPS